MNISLPSDVDSPNSFNILLRKLKLNEEEKSPNIIQCLPKRTWIEMMYSEIFYQSQNDEIIIPKKDLNRTQKLLLRGSLELEAFKILLDEIFRSQL